MSLLDIPVMYRDERIHTIINLFISFIHYRFAYVRGEKKTGPDHTGPNQKKFWFNSSFLVFSDGFIWVKFDGIQNMSLTE